MVTVKDGTDRLVPLAAVGLNGKNFGVVCKLLATNYHNVTFIPKSTGYYLRMGGWVHCTAQQIRTVLCLCRFALCRYILCLCTWICYDKHMSINFSLTEFVSEIWVIFR